jgi:hypothetical protein
MRTIAAMTFTALALMFGTVGSAQAVVVQAGSRAALGATDTIDWSVLGAPFTTVSNPFSILSTGGGVTTTVSQPGGGDFERRNEGFVGGWDGIFTPGQALLWNQDNTNELTMVFSVPLFAVGADIQSDGFGPFTANIEAFGAGNVLLGTFSVTGNNTGGSTGTAPFLGVISSAADITSIRYSIDFDNFGLAINHTSMAPVPEPGTLSLVGTGLVGLVGAIRRRRNAKKSA